MTCSGVGASSINVPSMSRNSAQSARRSGGGPRRTGSRDNRTGRVPGRVAVWRLSATVPQRADMEAAALAKDGSIEQHPPGPAVHIEFADDAAHESHPVALLFGLHRECM